MKKGFAFVFVSFMLLAAVFSTSLALADSGTDSGTDGSVSNSGSTDSAGLVSTTSDSDNSGSSEDGTTTSVETEDESETGDDDSDNETDRNEKREISRSEFKKEVRADDGTRVEVERKVRVNEDGTLEIRIKRKVTEVDGTETVKTIVIERSEDGIKKKIKLENSRGVEEVEVETELDIEDGLTGNETDIQAVASDGSKHKIIILPDRASEIALERLKALNFTVELKEINDRNVSRVVYNIETNKTGKFLGIFKTKIRLEGEVDPETGEILSVNKPWWAFLVSGEDSDQTAGTLNTATSSDGTVLANSSETGDATS